MVGSQRIFGALAAAMLAMGGSPLHAAEIPVTELTPQAVEGIPSGTMAMVEGTAGPEGDRFNVPGLSYFQPTSVTVVADRQGDDVRLKLGKFGWDEDFMGGSTRGEGYHISKFKTQGDLLISVIAEKPDTPYRLIVWTGEEQPPKFAPVLVPPSEAGGGLTKYLLIGLAALLALGGAFYLVRRRRAQS